MYGLFAATVTQVLRQVLKIRRRDLESWTERLREWLSSKMLKPLVRLIDGAHQEVRPQRSACPPCLFQFYLFVI